MERSVSDSAKIAIAPPLDYDEAFITNITPSMVITLDAGATSHMFSDRDLLSRYGDIEPSQIEVAAKNKPIYATGRGSARIQGLQLENILISSALGANLVSAGECMTRDTTLYGEELTLMSRIVGVLHSSHFIGIRLATACGKAQCVQITLFFLLTIRRI